VSDTWRWARFYDLGVSLFFLGRARALREKTVSLAGIAAGEAVLEAGCGTGALTLAAWRAAGPTGHVHGIDPSANMLDVARRKAARAGAVIDYRIASAEALPFADGSFDAVLSSLMMHHVPAELQQRAVTEMKRVLRPGGRLVIVDFRGSHGHTHHASLLAHRHRHHRRPEGPDIAGLLKAAGFDAVEVGDTNVRSLGFTRGRVATAP
jgi:demethylmenaquinone methyltransferase/2-methoxy-6-polyprenyl-1,4-benzoquinol methylase/phosphoethanolamine N-methyltransferase